MSEITDKYDKFLDSQCPWIHYLCDSCGFWATHPINYCPKCPGKIFQTKVSWLGHIKLYKNKNHIIDTCSGYAGIELNYPDEPYTEIIEHLRKRLT